MASSLTMTAGRVFWISLPTVGSRLMSQTSPRLIEVLAVEGSEAGQFSIRGVIWEQCLCSGSEPCGFLVCGRWLFTLLQLFTHEVQRCFHQCESLRERELLKRFEHCCIRHTISLKPFILPAPTPLQSGAARTSCPCHGRGQWQQRARCGPAPAGWSRHTACRGCGSSGPRADACQAHQRGRG